MYRTIQNSYGKNMESKNTKIEYSELAVVYGHMNKNLFKGTLPDCLITLQHGQRFAAYFCRDKFRGRKKNIKTHEIALNTDVYVVQEDVEILSSLVHEMVHLWQCAFGSPSRGGYHNKQWANKMESVGLMPSDTGQPGGRKTGQSMSDYIIPGGIFEKVAKGYLKSGKGISWQSNIYPIVAGDPGDPEPAERAQNKKNKIKYSCPGCNANAWGKPELNLICGDCEEHYIS